MTDAEQRFAAMCELAGCNAAMWAAIDLSNTGHTTVTIARPWGEVSFQRVEGDRAIMTGLQFFPGPSAPDYCVQLMDRWFDDIGVELNPVLDFPDLFTIQPDQFPIVASTFDALTQERPELRPHYERARLAWEASQ
ncbi:hypothetical protein [uncultured Brevundimonas sp.]|uniref:hypothetical protein n=1 Tax=uncultured Brevundimonas sp. TaxID=213418 RepID=UPI0025CECBA0|nr:hypothetical protein [uncultured Brevundimonas sp.]